MASYGSGKFARGGATGAVAVNGFQQIQRALSAIDRGTQRELRARFRGVGERVKTAARQNVPHATGRHVGRPSIEQGLKIAVLQRGASVYTTAPHGGVQNVGAWKKQGRGPHVSRANASHYMDKAVKQTAPYVEEQTEALVDWVVKTFERG